MVSMDVSGRPEKVVRRPANGESDGDGAEKTGDTTATSEHVGGPPTAYYAGSTFGPEFADNQNESTDDERSRDSEQQREDRHAVRATGPLPRPLL